MSDIPDEVRAFMQEQAAINAKLLKTLESLKPKETVKVEADHEDGEKEEEQEEQEEQEEEEEEENEEMPEDDEDTTANDPKGKSKKEKPWAWLGETQVEAKSKDAKRLLASLSEAPEPAIIDKIIKDLPDYWGIPPIKLGGHASGMMHMQKSLLSIMQSLEEDEENGRRHEGIWHRRNRSGGQSSI